MSEEKNQKSSKSNFLGISIILASLILGCSIIYASRSFDQFINTDLITNQKDSKTEEANGLEVTSLSHLKGNPDAPITIVEFSDFQCPFCQRYHPIIAQLISDYPNQVRWMYKHFPLDSIHPQARLAAEASECAAEQDKFWEFADQLFESQAILSSDLYQQLAIDLELNREQFQNCFDNRKYQDKVEADYQAGIKLGVRGTPASFINGESLVGAVPYNTLKSAVERARGNQ